MAAGFFISLEGPDGAGKTTQVELLKRALLERRLDAVFLREPGGTELGERIRQLLLHGPAMSPEAEMYLYMAARAELLAEVVKPALAAGRAVVLDRYHDSTMAYQGGGRGATVEWPQDFPKPDLTLLLWVTPEVGVERMRSAGRDLDRLELESLEFHRRVGEAYRRLAAAEPRRWAAVDAEGAPQVVHEAIMERVDAALAGRT